MRQARPGDRISITIEGEVLSFQNGDRNIGHGIKIDETVGTDYYLYVKDDSLNRTHLLWVHTAGLDCAYPPYKITDSKYRIGDLWGSGDNIYVCIMRDTSFYMLNTETSQEFPIDNFEKIRADATLIYRPNKK